MKRLMWVLGIVSVFSTTALAVDIAVSTQAGWFGQTAADREAQEIADNVTDASVELFTSTQHAALAAWVIAHTGDGESDLLILCGQFPDTIYPAGNTKPDGSIAELFLDDGNCIVNTGDWIFYVVNGAGTNAGSGLQNMMDIPGVTVAGEDDTAVTVTADGQLYTPSLLNFATDRPFHLDTLANDWKAELVLAQNAAGTRADPVIVVNSVTGGRIGIFYQTASQDNDPRGEVISEWINNWYLPTVAVPRVGSEPLPEDGAVDVPRDAVMSWKPGENAVTHDVYFGTAFEAVQEAGAADPRGVLVSQGQTDTLYDPDGLFEYGRTYYWRVDESNDVPGSTVFKGDVWSFTAETYAYPITGLTATVSAEQPASPAIRTIDGSGLDALDQHGVDLKQMWATPGGLPAWIQYTFDREYRVHELWVWNSNSELELFMGFGAKDVTIEYSSDGETWTALENVPEFAQATALPTYTANTIVDFGEVLAKYVRLTVNAAWGATGITGLSEVRFFYTPVQAFEPDPADGATGVAIDATLNWRPGRETTSHQVFFGTDGNAVAEGAVSAETVTDHRYAPAAMEFGTTYYWKVNEIGDAGTFQGDLWSITTEEYAVIDDFESYNDNIDAETTIWHAWVDGVTTKASGSQVGYTDAPFAEQTVVHGGKQSMPLQYDNTISPYFSEAYREFSPARDWTVGAADTLVLYFQTTGPDFSVPNAATPPVMDGTIDAMWANAPMLPVSTTIDGAAVTDPADASCQCRVLYDSANLYVLVEVNDDQLHNDSAATYLDDSVEIYIDGDNTKGQSPLAGLARQYTFGWSDTVIAGTNTDTTGVQIAQTNTPTGWCIEIKLPWQALIGAGAPVGNLIGIDCFYNDDDDGGDTRESQIAWHSQVGNDWQTPASWGTAMIAAPGAGDSADQFSVAVQDSSNHSVTVTYPSSEIMSAGWTEWRIPLSQFSTAGVRLNAVKRLTIGVGDKTAPKAGGAGIVFVDDIGFGHPASAND
ncbi:MAG: sugar-binding protein [Phycisphaerales bacterium]